MPSHDLVLAGLMHDLNNVFQTVGHAADLLSTDPNWKDTAEALLSCVERGRSIVDSIAESPGPVELAEVIRTAARFTGVSSLTVNLPADGVRFDGKRLALQRVFANLFLNSSRASRGACEICVSAYCDGDHAVIEVADNGPGIPEDMLERIFQPGFSTTASTGLGLHIVHAVVEEHHGSVSAANRGGAVFTIRIPLRSSL